MCDWEAGDLAVCVRDGTIRTPEFTHRGLGLAKGRTYKIVNCAIHEPTGQLCLWLEGVASRDGSLALRFRKIRPDAHEACEEEFVTLLKRRKVDA